MKPAELLAAYDALSKREKLMVALAVLALPGYLLHAFFMEPALVQEATAVQQLATARARMAQLSAEVAEMESQANAKASAGMERIMALRGELATQDVRFAQLEARMVPPGRMGGVLRDLLRHRPGLELVSLQSLRPEPARLEPTAQPEAPAPVPASLAAGLAAASGKPAVPAAAPKPIPEADLYLHGVELTVTGRYQDVLGWMSDLEALPQKMLWSGLSLKVVEYPNCSLRIRLQTLSREKTWLEL